MKTEPLTARQKQVLHLIRRHLSANGAPPTIRELREGLSLKSLRGVTVHLDALVRKGHIQRSRNARGIRLLRNGGPRELARQVPAGLAAVTPVPTLIPVVGRIAAGAPLLAEQHIEERLAVDPRFVPGPGCFAIRVHGDSMINAGISNGDYIMVRPQAEADNGQIVAVLIEGEATVKRFYRERGRIRLQPENPAVDPIFVNPRDQSVRVLGKVVGLFRKM
jgi:repressor LexA